MTQKLVDQIKTLDERLRSIEQGYKELGYGVKTLVATEVKKRWKIQPQSETQFGLFTCLVVDTIDPWKQNRVRFFSPLFHKPETPVLSLPFAYPISSMGGFDDCGLNWVPPAGSTLCVVFENGSRQSPYYIGTTWHRDRGPDGQHNWQYNIEEYYKIHEGHRKGYLVGPNDGSQVFPQWNTENYDGFDLDSDADFNEVLDAIKESTFPNIYGFKTPQKHMLKMVDGDYKCNHKNKRIEMLSSCGNWMIFKDDHLHECGSWGHPSCPAGPIVDCEDETTDCGGVPVPYQGNQFFKHQNECRPLRGPGTPQNNKCELPQSGIQFLSISGHSFYMDDKVKEPRGLPSWERSLQSFDFGCENIYEGKMRLVSATGHSIELNDLEDIPENRSDTNWIKLLTASGNKVELNDHTVPDCTAGEQRGIHLESTSTHRIDMVDHTNEQCSPTRREGGVPINEAKRAFIRVRSGYGLQFTMADFFTQKPVTEQQFIQIYSPQYTACCGPHLFHIQEDPGCGFIFTKAAGDYIVVTDGIHVTVVGDKDGCLGPQDKVTIVSKNTVISTCEVYFNAADLHAFLAKKIILLMAGEDCPIPGSNELGPCVWPVLVLSNKGITISDRVFASASPDAACASVFHLLPFHRCGEE